MRCTLADLGGRVALSCAVIALSACAGTRLSLPTDPGTPLPDMAGVHAQVSRGCSTVRTFTAELALSGHAGATRLRGRVIAGFGPLASMRLEGVAPFGPPAFVLASREGSATLVLPRDNAVVRDARPEALLEALTGVSLAPADLQAVLTGCVVAAPRATDGHLHANNWASIDLEGGATLYLRREDGRWVLRAARRGEWEIQYGPWMGTFPTEVRLRTSGIPGRTGAAPEVDLTATVSQVEANVDLEDASFRVTVPPGAESLTLDDVRAAGPLRGPS